MIIPSRRVLLLGLGASIVAPSLVRTESLMKLRGELLDPLILGCRYVGDDGLYAESIYDNSVNFPLPDHMAEIFPSNFSIMTIKEKAKELNSYFKMRSKPAPTLEYAIIHKSEEKYHGAI